MHLPEQDQQYVAIEPSAASIELSNLDSADIKRLFKQYGAILFRGFSLDVARFSSFADRFCKQFVSNESPGREVLSSDGRVQTVNLGHRHFPLHPEISREPWQPHIAFFGCDQPGEIGGETTICDGVAAVKKFSPNLLSHLKETTLAHTQPTTLGWCAAFLGKPDLQLPDLLNYTDTKTRFSIRDGEIFRTYLRPMLHKPMFIDEWAYGNFLVFARRQLQVRHFPCYQDGSEIPDELVGEIEQITNSLSNAINWRQNDVLMLDNTRFMHGRNPIGDPQTRRIITQFGYASFGPQDYQLENC